jgi:hypothetical protein
MIAAIPISNIRFALVPELLEFSVKRRLRRVTGMA